MTLSEAGYSRHRLARALALQVRSFDGLTNGTALTCRFRQLLTSGRTVMTVTDITALPGGTVMRIFVTGAPGWIGSAVVPELLGAGHEVVGLARSDASALRLEEAGVVVQRGDIDDPDGLAKAADDSDGVIHLAFQHEVAFGGDSAAAANADRRAVEAMGAVLAESDRPFVLASGMLGIRPGRVATEDDGLVPSVEVRGNPAGRRAATALLTLSFAGTGVRSSVLRLPRLPAELDLIFVSRAGTRSDRPASEAPAREIG